MTAIEATNVTPAAPQAKYVVLNGHTLCYRIDATPTMLGVLAGSVRRGGHNPMNGAVFIGPNCELHEATQLDFDDFRVCSKYHLT